MEAARDAAYSRYLHCQAEAEEKHNRDLEVQGRPVPGKKGEYVEKIPGSFDKLQQQENFEDTECRKVYEAELGLIQPHVQQQESTPK